MNKKQNNRINKNNFEENFTQSSANFSQSNIYNNDQSNTQNQQGEAIQLLTINSQGKVQLNSQALDIIASYNDKPVGFVVLVGKYRTGKSFLLNKLLFAEKNCFKVQQYTKSCTQGIWMWTNPFLNQYLGNYLFFLDTQGLASIQKGQQYNIKLFTIATLISSYLIYNSVGCIDQRSISDLNAVTKLSKNILTDQSLSVQQNQRMLYDFMPKFCWVIRDFTLELADERGRKITPKQYLQNSLKQDNTHVKINDDTRKVKRSLLTYFKDRDCITLVRPAKQQSQIQSLHKISDIHLRRQFIQGVNALREKIQRNASCKKFQGKQIFGNEMASMIQSYSEAINNGKIPSIKTAWEQVADNQGQMAYGLAHSKYLQLFQENFSDQQPKQQKALYKILSSMKQQSIAQFMRNASSDDAQHKKKLKDWISHQQQAIIQANDNAMNTKNLQILKQQSHELMRKVQSNYYLGKKPQYDMDLKKVLQNYRRRAIGDKKQALISQFLQTTNQISTNLQKQPQNYQNNQYLVKEQQLRNKIKMQQLQAKQNQTKIANNLANQQDKKNQKINQIKKKKQKNPDKAGCCGGKCQIM